MRKYRILITSLFLLMLATGLYGESDDQPKWNTTLFGSYFFGGRSAFGIGGALGYQFTHRLELEGEVYTFSWYHYRDYSISGGLLCNFDTDHNKTILYVVGALSQIIGAADKGIYFMFGGGLKIPLTRSFKIRLDFRLYMVEDFPSRLSTGLMWSF